MREPSYGIAIALTPGTPIPEYNADAPVAGFMVKCTVAGDVSVKLSGGVTLPVAVGVGTTIFPLAVLLVNVAGTTATATYYALA